MADDNTWTKDDDLQALRETRSQLEIIEREWKHWRNQSKALTIKLVTEHGVSVAKASQLSGHHRNTIGIWLQIHNAEHKNRQEKN